MELFLHPYRKIISKTRSDKKSNHPADNQPNYITTQHLQNIKLVPSIRPYFTFHTPKNTEPSAKTATHAPQNSN